MTARLGATDIGAWLFRCNPTDTDLSALRTPGGIDSRCAVATYRIDLVRADVPVVLWLTGPSTSTAAPPGVWMLGYTSGTIDRDDDNRNDNERNDTDSRPRLRIGLRDMTPLRPPLPRAHLATHPATRGLEVLRQPFGANPSYLTLTERRELAAMIGGWPS